eukprot:gene25631-1714_t
MTKSIIEQWVEDLSKTGAKVTLPNTKEEAEQIYGKLCVRSGGDVSKSLVVFFETSELIDEGHETGAKGVDKTNPLYSRYFPG